MKKHCIFYFFLMEIRDYSGVRILSLLLNPLVINTESCFSCGFIIVAVISDLGWSIGFIKTEFKIKMVIVIWKRSLAT